MGRESALYNVIRTRKFIIKKHALLRYKQRIAKRRLSNKQAEKCIKESLLNPSTKISYNMSSGNIYYFTPNFIAVVRDIYYVITILEIKSKEKRKEKPLDNMGGSE
jgi:hypothetical protein